MTTPSELTTLFFYRWLNQFPGKFLSQNDGELVVDRTALIDHAPLLSGGEQIYAAAWWELIVARPAPWLRDEMTALSHLTVLDADHRQSVIDLIDGVHRYLALDRR